MEAMTKTIEPETETEAKVAAVGFQLHIRMPGIRARIPKDRVDLGDAQQEMVHLSKDIIDSDEFRAVQGQGRVIRAFVRSRSTPSPLLKGGVYLLPMDLVEEVEGQLDAMKAEYNQRVETFIKAYPQRIEEARKKLGNLFDPEDYPSAATLRAAFGVETAYVSMETPSRLKTVSRALFERERERAEERWRDLKEDVAALLRAEMKNYVDSMVSSLTPTEDGKKRAFRGATVNKLTEFLRTAPFRNISGDAELERMVKAAADLLEGLDPEIVRKDDFYRKSLRESFEVLKQRTDKLAAEKPKRAISFDDECE
jgi:hypothetical protein